MFPPTQQQQQQLGAILDLTAIAAGKKGGHSVVYRDLYGHLLVT